MPEEEKKEVKVVLKAPGQPSVKASEVTQVPAKEQGAEDTNTQKQARRTIKLKPLRPENPPPEDKVEETISMERDELTDKLPASAGGRPDSMDDDDLTVKVKKPATPSASPTATVQKPPAEKEKEEDATVQIGRKATNAALGTTATATAAAPAQPGEKPAVPGAKQTIKLRPSSVPPAAASTAEDGAAPAAKPTIKLSPKSAGGEAPPEKTKKTIRLSPTTASASPPGVKPSDPTVKMAEDAQAGADASVKPGDVTTEMPEDKGGAEPPPKKTGLKLKRDKQPEPTAEGGAPDAGAEPGGVPGYEDDMGTDGVPTTDEPSIIFSLVAIFTLFIIGFLAFMLFAQFGSQWQDMKIQVPGISGKVK